MDTSPLYDRTVWIMIDALGVTIRSWPHEKINAVYIMIG